jgi:hypothetical protein
MQIKYKNIRSSAAHVYDNYNSCFCQFCRKISWCYGLHALLYECWHKTRRTRTWVISPDCKEFTPELLFDRSSEDAYSSPGSPMMCRTRAGTLVIAKIKISEGTYILMKGQGATPKGSVPFVDLLNMYADLFQPFLLYLIFHFVAIV